MKMTNLGLTQEGPERSPDDTRRHLSEDTDACLPRTSPPVDGPRSRDSGARPKCAYVVTGPKIAYTLLRGQLRYMQSRGMDVILITAPGPDLEQVEAREGVATEPVPMLREPSPLRDVVSLVRLTRTLRRLRPHIVHFSTPKAGLLGALASRMLRVPIRLYTLRGIRSEGFSGLKAGVFNSLERVACACSHRTYCVSESVRRRALELRLAPGEKLRVLGGGSSNGVDSERFRRTPELLERARELRHRIGLPEGVPVVGFVGRLVRDKGGVELVEAFRSLLSEFPNLHLLLIGSFEQYNGLPEDCRRAIVQEPRVKSTGWLDDTSLGYTLADVLALPTYREGLPNVVLEASSMELPVVATRVTGCVDAVVDGATGILAPPRDPEALAAALRTYLGDPELRARHGRAGRERAVGEFQPGRVWGALFDEYVACLQAKGLPVPEGSDS